jgi:hypothetical protein
MKMSNWIKEIVDEISTNKLNSDAIPDYLFLQKQMKLRFKSRRYEYTESDMALLTLVFAIKWLKKFSPLKSDKDTENG